MTEEDSRTPDAGAEAAETAPAPAAEETPAAAPAAAEGGDAPVVEQPAAETTAEAPAPAPAAAEGADAPAAASVARPPSSKDRVASAARSRPRTTENQEAHLSRPQSRHAAPMTPTQAAAEPAEPVKDATAPVAPAAAPDAVDAPPAPAVPEVDANGAVAEEAPADAQLDANGDVVLRSSRPLSAASVGSVGRVLSREDPPAVEEEEKDVPDTLEEQVAAIQAVCSLDGVTAEMWTDEAKSEAAQFFESPEVVRLFLYATHTEHQEVTDEGDFRTMKVPKLFVSSSLPRQASNDVMYLIKEGARPLRVRDMDRRVQYGVIRGNAMESLMRLMNGIFVGFVLENEMWPGGVKSEFCGQLHKFMAYLTDACHQTKGHTVLYVPREDLGDVLAAARDKELVQRLELALIHWTRQIKEVVNTHDTAEIEESFGPLEEIAFWTYRSEDLSRINDQLKGEGVARVVAILSKAKSSYLESFVELSNKIQEGYAQAKNNLKFLSVLKRPCEELDAAGLKEIPTILPRLLNDIRFIWANSDFYHTKERLTALLRKVSNRIIARCCSKISLDEMFNGDVEASIVTLQDSIRCAEEWKSVYANPALNAKLEKHCGRKWEFDHSSIFAQIDAFVQRCRDLLDVCDGQIQFTFAAKGKKGQLPHFGGARGPSTLSSLGDIEASFQKHLQPLRGIKSRILDVKDTSWHDHYTAFKKNMKELEGHMQNVMASAFETATSIEAMADLVEAFHHLAHREAIKQSVDKKINEVWAMFVQDLNVIKREFDSKKKKPEVLPIHPRYAGAAMWARAFLMRVRTNMALLQSKHYFMATIAAADATVQQEQLTRALEEFINKAYLEWVATVNEVGSGNLSTRLESTLMARAKDSDNLEVHFDTDLNRLFVEVHYWEKLKFDIPYQVHDVLFRREELRVLREHVTLLVRDYNNALQSLDKEEKLLFRERIFFLDKKMRPGVTKYNWAAKGNQMGFIQTCRKHAAELQRMIDHWKGANRRIHHLCKLLGNTMLVEGLHVKNRVYSYEEFRDMQEHHRVVIKDRLRSLHSEILQTVEGMYETFRKDGKEVQKQWRHYLRKTDRLVETSLRRTVKESLKELSRAINGDGKKHKDVPPMFNINLVLARQTVEFEPTIATLEEMVTGVVRSMIECISVVPNIRQGWAVEKEAGPSGPAPSAGAGGAAAAAAAAEKDDMLTMYEIISREEDVKKIQAYITEGIGGISKALKDYLKTWDPYREIWEINKDAFIRRYAKLNPPLSTFDADINRYNEVANNVQKEETIVNIAFVSVDCGPLKYTLLSHCHAWQNKFTALLNEMAKAELNALHTVFRQTRDKLAKPPTSLDELSDSFDVLNHAKGDLPAIENRFGPVNEQYRILEKYEKQVSEDEQRKLESLGAAWAEFNDFLQATERALNASGDEFKRELMQARDEFARAVELLRDEFANTAPFAASVPAETAFKAVTEFRGRVEEATTKERTISRGLALFKIDHVPSKDVLTIERDLDFLEKLWKLDEEWTVLWEKWKTMPFGAIDVANVEDTANKFQKRMQRLGREIKELSKTEWGVFTTLKGRVDQFKRTLPLIQDMKNPAIRDRHWAKLMEEIQKTFDPHSPDFNLEAIVGFGLDQYSDLISDLSGAASKELSIEQALQTIEEAWRQQTLDVVVYKTEYFRLRSTDDLFQLLEDNSVALSTMKASRYCKPFEKQLDHWERTLSLVMETVEMVLQVQRQWMYLENIFVGSEDIRKQLPAETGMFDIINDRWRRIVSGFHKNNGVLACTTQESLLATLTEMNTSLERIQKMLDMYLESKRQAFPRFYFLSNDDILEILGQSRNPEAVQQYLKKCFDNIRKLELRDPEHSGGKYWEALGMHSGDGEYVPFHEKVVIEGPVEQWLCAIEAAMRSTLRHLLFDCITSVRKTKRDKWVRDWAGQLLITTSQIVWTADCTKALAAMRDDKGALKLQRKKQMSLLNKLSEMVRGDLTKIERAKLVALITIEVHSRDVVDNMLKVRVSDPTAFEWLSQLRFYWEKEEENCVIRQTNTRSTYGYEYLGNAGRLVVTPLTDRCYVTLTMALSLFKGGAPQGPAGTGKTETVKDLGKAMANYVIVTNCSDGLDHKSMGRMFSGLAQTGAWGCFDEFNRINIEVLSVVAQQVSSIQTALKRAAPWFVFEGMEIRLKPSCGTFITMNPGYAGRTELPDNLKSMFRPVSMVVPDTSLIAEIILFADGFSNTRVLAKKADTLYKLCFQQLSKQDHYDFGLRALVSVLKAAGNKKRAEPEMNDETVLMLSMRDMNQPKLAAQDVPLFQGILSDLFPGVESLVQDYGVLRQAVEKELRASGKQVTESTVLKVIQLFETKCVRHGVMIVGATGSGKSVVWKTLQATLTRLRREGVDNNKYNAVRSYMINPKSISMGELYGEFNAQTGEWYDGILSSVMRTVCGDDRPDEKWVVLDGPVDTLWIESMNTVLDDNKVLTLVNGERMALPPQVGLLFEVENLAVASPATVSRCGMIYMDFTDLGWQPYVETWLQQRQDGNERTNEILRGLFEKYVQRTLQFRRAQCKELVPITDLNGVMSLCNLLDALIVHEESGIGPETQQDDGHARLVENWFIFAVIWSLGASVDSDSRKRFDMFIREIEGQFPSKDTVYEYYVDAKKRSWTLWDERIQGLFRFPPSTPFHKILVPTVDTVRNDFLIRALMTTGKRVLVVGDTGVGKTAVIQQALAQLDDQHYSVLNVNFSANVQSKRLQGIVESKIEKRTKDTFVPVGGKNLIAFLDDFNMPARDEYGSQPPLELLKHWMDYGFMYDREKCTVKHIKGMQILAAMGPPGGGRNPISARVQSRFNLINMTSPSEAQMKRIFSSLVNNTLQDFDEEIKPLGDIMTQATIDVYNTVSATLLPTPTKIHYLFNLRDVSRVFQGLMRANKDYYDTRESMAKLWLHECYRVFSDRLVDQQDRDWFQQLMVTKLYNLFDVNYSTICPDNMPPLFGDFMRKTAVGSSGAAAAAAAGAPAPGAAPVAPAPADEFVYEDLHDLKALKQFVREKLEDYNLEPGNVQCDLVLFRDAIEHIARIVRVVRQPRGNMLLIGVGGSGRQSLTRLAAYIVEYGVFSIEITKNYREQEFHEDLKTLYRRVGVDCKPTVFLFSDTQIVYESFLEDVNNILSSGEVPNLFPPEEFTEIREAIRADASRDGVVDTPQAMYAYFIERARANMHIVLCMSPVGKSFRNRIRMFPALVNCATIDWFSEWPRDALLEVALHYTSDVNLGTPEILKNVSETFVTAHASVVEMSRRMLFEVKRHNYVTPTNYLQLVKGYTELLAEKRAEFGSAANKLRGGLLKVDETKATVQSMSQDLEQTKRKVAQYQKQCEEYLVVLVQQKREADDQQRSVAARSEKLAKEEREVKVIADAAQTELDEALPALEQAKEALDNLDKKAIQEVKSYGKPPAHVEMVLEAVMVLFKAEPSWAEAKRQLADPNFIRKVIDYDKDNMSDRILQKIAKYCANPDFQPDVVGRVSKACKSLCMWVRAMEVYGRVLRQVAPKREKLAAAKQALETKQASLHEAEAKLAEVTEKMEELKRQYDEKLALKDKLRREADETEEKLGRAAKLVSGLSGERDRWEKSIASLEASIAYLPGDCLLASAFLSYAGPFSSNYRVQLVKDTWLAQVKRLEVPCNPNFDFALFLARPTDVRQWRISGLPSDDFSTENGVLVTRTRRWPLMVDPQNQANKWIKSMEGGNGLKVIDLSQADYLRTLENAVQFGTPVLLQNILEEIDPALEPILNKSFIKQGNRLLIRLGDKEVEYNPEFRLYLTTKLANPHYTPEISTKTTIVNFAVKERGLEDQLLGIVVRKEKPELEEQKDELVIGMAAGQKKLAELEDEILSLLSTAQGSLLDDEKLVLTLQSAKSTSEEVKEKIVISEQTELKIDAAREGYRPCAQRASILFFVLNDMASVDPMYQFSLESYISSFNISIDRAEGSQDLKERIANINEYHTYAVYRGTCRGLFEQHKLLFSFQMCAKILAGAGKLNRDEYEFFLRGGQVLDRDQQQLNPCRAWLSDTAWDNVTELEKLAAFSGIANSFEQSGRDWAEWFQSPEPETAPLPIEWENKCDEMQRMLILRSLRPDRVVFAARNFVVNNLGSRFVEPPTQDIGAVFEASTPESPIIFVLSSGVDPAKQLVELAQQCGMSDRFHQLSLGEGQAPIATRLIRDGVLHGHWVFLANCHLSISWMPALDKIVENLRVNRPHKDFRLWLSSAPHPDFPISILQSSIKLTTEPPQGIRANLTRLYNLITEPVFAKCTRPEKYKKLLFSLCFFHSVLLERRKFMSLGWNIPYGFNDSDFETCELITSIYLSEYEQTPWESLKYLIAEVSYGGRVTDDWDRRVLRVYINELYCEEALFRANYRLSPLQTYYIPDDGPLQSYKDYVQSLPTVDKPEAFGQHPNADIASQIKESNVLLDTLMALQPRVSVAGGETREDKVFAIIEDIEGRLPEDLDYAAVEQQVRDDPTPLNIVLIQEVSRYNSLLATIRSSLVQLKKGVKGLVVMSAELEETMNYIHDARVPPLWGKTYASLKPLAAWTRDLLQRTQQLADWITAGTIPRIFWLSGFAFPTGFLTAVLQTTARKMSMSVDTLMWEFSIIQLEERDIKEHPSDGVYIKGLYLEGAGWDRRALCLQDPKPMELVTSMPIVHFKPVENKKKATKGVYACPLYTYPVRQGSFIIAVDLKSGTVEPEHWVKRGTALLLSLDV